MKLGKLTLGIITAATLLVVNNTAADKTLFIILTSRL